MLATGTLRPCEPPSPFSEGVKKSPAQEVVAGLPRHVVLCFQNRDGGINPPLRSFHTFSLLGKQSRIKGIAKTYAAKLILQPARMLTNHSGQLESAPGDKSIPLRRGLTIFTKLPSTNRNYLDKKS